MAVDMQQAAAFQKPFLRHEPPESIYMRVIVGDKDHASIVEPDHNVVTQAHDRTGPLMNVLFDIGD